mmetsp:Transcript_19965/g.28603  ORF Transcript_19965/g.28603 Transcript_19965/m.28603 type:complete len:582 (+) Transcript_19965:16-1761(+)
MFCSAKAISLLLLLIFSSVGLFLLYLHTVTYNASTDSTSLTFSANNLRTQTLAFKNGMKGGLDLGELLNIIVLQNETISSLKSTIASLDSARSAKNEVTLLLRSDPQYLSNNKLFKRKENPIQLSDSEKDCESRYGMQLVEEWRKSEQIWCKTDPNNQISSELRCFPYHQKHKQLDGRGPDMFCEATNFVIDFSKVHGDHSTSKPALYDQYLSFGGSSLLSSCSKTNEYQPQLFMPHHSLQMNSFEADSPNSETRSSMIEELPTYLLARDEDCENSFHSTADFMNMFLVKSVLQSKADNMQVMLFDKHPDGPYLELIQQAFANNKPVLRHQHYRNQKVMFRRLIFHLESPAGLIFPKVSRPDPMRCYRTSLFDSYRRFVLNAFGLLNVPPPEIPSVALSLRHRTASKNVGRILANEAEVVAVLKEGNMMDLNVVDTSSMKFSEQLKLIRNTNVLVGVHGAGLMFIMFAADEAVLVEIHPSYRQDRHFRHAARLTGKIYMPLRSHVREHCQGSSDSVTVPIEEFKQTMDGALRIARSFDDGLSECGLVCPLNILALDSKLDSLYSRHGLRKSSPVNTQFPCG